MTVFPYWRNCAAVSRGDIKGGNRCARSRKSFIHLNRGSEGENWKPHFICWPPFGEGERELADPFVPLLLGATYAISEGTLSEVMPLPPGHLHLPQLHQFKQLN
jgi:hypothetical protein